MPEFADQAHLAAHGARQFLDYGKAKARPAVAARYACVSLREFLEDQRLLFFGDAWTRVAHIEAQTLVRSRQHFDDHAAGLGEFHCVAGEIEKNLPQAAVIAADPRRRAIADDDRKLEIFPARFRRQQFGDVLHRAFGIKRGKLKRDAPCFEARVIENLGDEIEQQFARLADGGDIAFSTWFEFAEREQVGHADDAVQRRAQFVRERGEQRRLGAQCVIGGFGMAGDIARHHQACAVRQHPLDPLKAASVRRRRIEAAHAIFRNRRGMPPPWGAMGANKVLERRAKGGVGAQQHPICRKNGGGIGQCVEHVEYRRGRGLLHRADQAPGWLRNPRQRPIGASPLPLQAVRFSNVNPAHDFGAVEIGDAARDLKRAVIRARRERQCFRRFGQEGGALRIRRGGFLQRFEIQHGIELEPALTLCGARPRHAGGGFSSAFQFLPFGGCASWRVIGPLARVRAM